MEKKKISWTVGELTYDESKQSFSGFVNGDYVVMKQSKNGKFYLQAYRDVTFFEPRQNNQQAQTEEDPFK